MFNTAMDSREEEVLSSFGDGWGTTPSYCRIYALTKCYGKLRIWREVVRKARLEIIAAVTEYYGLQQGDACRTLRHPLHMALWREI
jgi:hypothetical protein